MTGLVLMLIDDSEEDQFLTRYMIQKQLPDATLIQVYDGEEALEKLETLEVKPQLIMLDINMPRMSGHDFLKEYDTRFENKIPIAMLTSSLHDQDRYRASAYESVVHYFDKPLEPGDIALIAQLV